MLRRPRSCQVARKKLAKIEKAGSAARARDRGDRRVTPDTRAAASGNERRRIVVLLLEAFVTLVVYDVFASRSSAASAGCVPRTERRGKSTLLKMVAGYLTRLGEVRLGAALKVGYFLGRTARFVGSGIERGEQIDHAVPAGRHAPAIAAARRFDFPGDDSTSTSACCRAARDRA